MAAAEGSRKLLCACGKPLAVFDALTEPPVVRFVMVASFPTHPAPALP